jgi:hypothetical protein
MWPAPSLPSAYSLSRPAQQTKTRWEKIATMPTTFAPRSIQRKWDGLQNINEASARTPFVRAKRSKLQEAQTELIESGWLEPEGTD